MTSDQERGIVAKLPAQTYNVGKSVNGGPYILMVRCDTREQAEQAVNAHRLYHEARCPNDKLDFSIT